MRVLLAGGGTAGHCNPAIAIASVIKAKNKNAKILFVGNRVDGDKPAKILHCKITGDIHSVDFFLGILVRTENAGHNGIPVGLLKGFQTHISPANG